MRKKRLVTSALPYVNNIPHLGNLIQVLSADVFARYCRERGYETMYVCGTDEYGTATETRALAEGVTPRELCDRYHTIHSDIYKWFNIDFDYFGRTSTDKQTEIVQSIFKAVDSQGYISEKEGEQLFCESCDRYLADRFVLGECPHCGSENARGDQCEDCGKLLDTTDLISPKCSTCNSTPNLRKTKHLYIDLPKSLPLLEKWMESASVDGFWAKNAIAMTKSWIRDGLKERCITRDLKWGIPVPKKGYEDKVFYVWFDAPIGYVSITASYTDEWEKWWKNPDNVELFQFIGKDNIPFHTVIFPSSLLATGGKWTMLHHMSSSEYLNYENGKFSKSKGTGVFGNDVQDSTIPADVWRFYIFYNRPEKSDVQFTWKDFQEKVNGELIGNFGNLVNRTLTFVNRFYDGKIPEGEIDKDIRKEADSLIKKIDSHYDKAQLRDAIRTVLQLSDLGNKTFQAGEPWKMRKENPQKAASLLRTLTFLVRDLAILIRPYLPETALKIAGFFGDTELNWDCIAKENFSEVQKPEILFSLLDDELIDGLKIKYSGSQEERNSVQVQDDSLETQFSNEISLKVGKIIEIVQHPEADRLYVEKIDMGNGVVKQIVSGLVAYYSADELLNKNVVVVDNLKPAKLRGVISEGMVLAAEGKKGDKKLELLFINAKAGTLVHLEKNEPKSEYKSLKIDRFFELPMVVKDKTVYVGDSKLTCDGSIIKCSNIITGTVG